MEIWRNIEGFNGKYQVSSWGRIRNAETGTVLKPYQNKKGYFKVGLSFGGKSVKKRVNRIVAMAFIENPDNLPQVNHKDGNKQNNSVSNLEWVTDGRNKEHAKNLRRGEINA